MPRSATLIQRTLATTLFLAGAFTTAGGQNGVSADASRVTASSARRAALKELDPADLAFWKNIRFATLSNDGKWFAYQLTPNEGDAEVVVRPTGDGEERRFKIGEPPAPTGGFGGGGGNTS